MTVLERPIPPFRPAPAHARPPSPAHARRLHAVAGDELRGSPRWQWWVGAAAVLASVTTTVLVHLSGRAGLFGDEPSHLLHGRRFFASLTPGFGQLGNYWPPLLHVAELPFAWNSWLTRTGLAGAIPAMAMFVVAALGAYALGTDLSRDRRIGALASLVFVANPNMLYLQSSAMMESGIAMTLVWTAVWLLRFSASGRFRDAVWAGAWSGLAVFATWAAFVLPVYGGLIVAQACRRNGFPWPKTRAFVAAYSLLCGYAVLLWLGWNWYLQGDPLYMLHYRHPTGVGAAGPGGAGSPMQPDLWRGLLSYVSAVWDSFGPVVTIAAVVVLVVAVVRRKFLHPLGVTLLGAMLVLAEFARGQGGLIGSPTFAAIEGLHGRTANGMNIRYVLWVIPFLAGAVALAARGGRMRFGATALVVVLSLVWFAPSLRGAVTLHSGDMMTKADEQRAVVAAHDLDRSYHGGLILTVAAGGGDRLIWLSNVPDRRFVTEFNPKLYGRALRAPASVASYVLSTPTLRETLPESRLLAAGFVQAWSINVGGDDESLWVRPAPAVSS